MANKFSKPIQWALYESSNHEMSIYPIALYESSNHEMSIYPIALYESSKHEMSIYHIALTSGFGCRRDGNCFLNLFSFHK